MRRGPRRSFNEVAEWDDKGAPAASVREVIVRELGRGLPGEMASQFANVPYATYRDWLVDGRRLIRRAQTEPGFTPAPEDADLMEFCVEVSQALAGWVQRVNGVLEAGMYSRRKTQIRVKTEVVRASDGTIVLRDGTQEPLEVEVERTVTTTEEPIDTTPITWRLARVAPQIYGANPRYEQEDEAGESETIDIAKRVVELMDRIEETLTIAPEDPE